MTTENDLGTAAAAAALFHLHTSPLVNPMISNTFAIPALTLPGQASANGAAGQAVAPSIAESAISLVGIGRPRSVSWDPTFATLSMLGALGSNKENSDASAADTLCALMKSDVYPVSTDSSGKSLRPRSMSTSAALSAHTHVKVDKGLRPRSTSVSSATQAQASLKRSRPRSYSTSSKASARSVTSSRRKRALSVDSTGSGFFNLDDPLSDEDEGDADDAGSTTLDELRKIGQYSPSSRQKRIERFLDKRRRRIWRKRIKYDVRKNFADSRLRVKGRFVRKEDEDQLREYFQML